MIISNYKIKFNLTSQCAGGLFLSLWASSERQNILQENLNCHAVHPHVTITYEKVRFNKSRRAVLTVCVTDHQHCSRNPIFTSGLSLQPHHLWRICYIFWAGGGGEEALSKWHLISLWGIPFQVGESKTTNVLHLSCGQKREGGGGSADFWRRHTLEILIRSHQVQCGQMEANSLINSCTCHTLRSHRQRLSFCFTVDGHFLSFFFFLLSPHSFPLWQAGLSLIVSFMTDTKWGLALIQGRPCTGILWFLSTSVADVWWWHIWQKPSKMQGWWVGGLRVCLLRQTQLRMNWDKTFYTDQFSIFSNP